MRALIPYVVHSRVNVGRKDDGNYHGIAIDENTGHYRRNLNLVYKYGNNREQVLKDKEVIRVIKAVATGDPFPFYLDYFPFYLDDVELSAICEFLYDHLDDRDAVEHLEQLPERYFTR